MDMDEFMPALLGIVLDLVEATAQTGAFDVGDRAERMDIRLAHLQQMLAEAENDQFVALCAHARGAIRNVPHIKRLYETR